MGFAIILRSTGMQGALNTGGRFGNHRPGRGCVPDYNVPVASGGSAYLLKRTRALNPKTSQRGIQCTAFGPPSQNITRMPPTVSTLLQDSKLIFT